MQLKGDPSIFIQQESNGEVSPITINHFLLLSNNMIVLGALKMALSNKYKVKDLEEVQITQK